MENHQERREMLAYVAEKYYRENLRQTDIAQMIGVTRSAVSRMLSEAREKGIVEILIHHPLQFNHGLEDKLKQLLPVKRAVVLELNNNADYQNLRKRLGEAAARLMTDLIKPGDQIGVSWGTTVQASIEELDAVAIPKTRVVQLVGVLGSTRHSYSAQTLVEVLAEKIGGEGIYLYSPFIVENKRTAASLLDDPAVEESIIQGESSDIALIGIGTTVPEYCSLLNGNHITAKELDKIRSAKAVGDVCAIYFDDSGNVAKTGFHQRRIGISPDGLRKIPLRLGVAGNVEKAEAILGAIRGGFINLLVTDSLTALRVLELDQMPI